MTDKCLAYERTTCIGEGQVGEGLTGSSEPESCWNMKPTKMWTSNKRHAFIEAIGEYEVEGDKLTVLSGPPSISLDVICATTPPTLTP